jgi:hypothetical protein
VPDHVKHLLVEPVSLTQDIASPTSPTSPLSDEEGMYRTPKINWGLLFGDLAQLFTYFSQTIHFY